MRAFQILTYYLAHDEFRMTMSFVPHHCCPYKTSGFYPRPASDADVNKDVNAEPDGCKTDFRASRGKWPHVARHYRCTRSLSCIHLRSPANQMIVSRANVVSWSLATYGRTAYVMK